MSELGMHASYSLFLVAVSIGVGTLAGYTTLDLASRIAILKCPRVGRLWLVGGAISLGIGIWSMHFVGMLSMTLPISVGYDLTLTASSLLIAILTAYCALRLMTCATLRPKKLAGGAVVVALGIGGMHYIGMAAMLMSPGIVYRPSVFAGSILMALGASFIGIRIVRALISGSQERIVRRRVFAAVLLGVNVTAVHYTGMAAATFLPGAVCGAAAGINSQWLAATVTLFTLAILTISVILSLHDKRTTFLAGSLSDLNGQIVRMATYDSLTNLPNRRTLNDRIEAVIRSFPKAGGGFVIFFLGLDGFKSINDAVGHAAADGVLQEFSRRLLSCVSGGDTVARLGGDEFAVLLQNDASVSSAEAMAAMIHSRLKSAPWLRQHPFQVRASIGIAFYPKDGKTADALLKNAGAAMFEAKRQAPGSHRFFEVAMNEAAERILDIQNALREALQEGYFVLHYQPKFCGADLTLSGAEALLRLHHPKLGTVAPLDFIPIAEQSGQVIQIGYWVVSEVCRQLRAWRNAGLPPVKIAVNLSPVQLAEKDLVENMLALLRSEQVPPGAIMFEITESVAMQDAARTVDTIQQFQAHGFDFAIDDFGTGYSSLAYLQRFRVKQLKIDRFFVNGLEAHGAEGAAIVRAIIVLAHSLNMEVVAEGVETDAQLHMLQAMQCDQIQGYLLGKPVPQIEFAAMMQRHIPQPA